MTRIASNIIVHDVTAICVRSLAGTAVADIIRPNCVGDSELRTSKMQYLIIPPYYVHGLELDHLQIT